MKHFISIFISLFITTICMADSSIDKSEELNGVLLKSGKEESTRLYVGSVNKTFPYPMNIVKSGITNFAEKCNNNLKDKRTFTSKDTNCKYHNENLVESFIVKDIKQAEYFKDLSEYYLIGRQIYNRGSFGYYELVTIREGLNDKKQKVMTISLKMLNDSEVKLFTNLKIKKESAFDNSTSIYNLTEISPTETYLQYEYTAETDHWLLNKEVSVPQVFAAISKSINDLVKTVDVESSIQKRELASKN